MAKLLKHDGIIRNTLKIKGTIKNAKAFVSIQKEYGSFDDYIWQFVNYKTISHAYALPSQIPTTSPESDTMSVALKKKGFTFVGSTICYAYMQAAGLVNDHLVTCKRYKLLLDHFSNSI